MTNALAALGLLSLITSGELERWASVLLCVALAAAVVLPDRFQDHPWLRTGGAGAAALLLVAQVGRLFLGGDALQLSVEFAAALQIVRLVTRRGAAHDQQIILLALLHLVAGTVLGGGLAYGLCFVGFLVVAPGALVLSHLRREVEGNYRQGARDRTGLPVDVPRILRSRRVISRRFLAVTCSLSIPIFLFTAVLFVLFPRVGLSLLLLNHSRSSRMIGFSDRVDLGGVGKLRSDPTIAMRVHPSGLAAEPPPRIALYLRGTAFDQYDGRSWSRSQTRQHPSERTGRTIWTRPRGVDLATQTMTIDLEPIDPPVIFLPPDTVAFKLHDRGDPVLDRSPKILAGPEGEVKYSSSDERGLRYEVFFKRQDRMLAELLPAKARTRYLTLPANLTDRIATLARTWAGPLTDPLQIAREVERKLRTDYRYDLESPSGAAENPLDHFLFESKRGHCEFYSTAMATMLRTLGIPTRNVTGFIGGTFNRFGRFYAVRQGDAHSWVEAHIPGRGWVRFDPTPPAGSAPTSEMSGVLAFMRDIVEAAAQRWSRHVIGYNLDQQVQLLRNVSRRYTALTGGRSWLNGGLSRRRTLVGVGGLLLVGVSIYWWRRRRRSLGALRLRSEDPGATALQALVLYRSLEHSMAARGVPRTATTPPLAHANGLAALGHPTAPEVLDLTTTYLEARFGGRTLTEREVTEFSDRVKRLRTPPEGRSAAFG